MNDGCIFCRIVAGTIPGTKVYEDADVLVFMDISPVTKGHALVIPKAHHDPITNVPAALLQKVIVVVQKIAAAQVEWLKADGVNVTQANGKIAGQVIPHVHFHVLPRYDGERSGAGLTVADAGWPGQPNLAQAVKLDETQIAALTGWLKPYFA